MMRNRKKQAAARTIASVVMINAASRKLLKKKRVRKTQTNGRCLRHMLYLLPTKSTPSLELY